jgi:hypothetical protein
MRYFHILILHSGITGAKQLLHEVESARLEDILLEERFNNLLPGLIDETGIDLWILISRTLY